MPAPLAIPIVARFVLYGVVAGAVAAVGWMIKEIHKDDEKQRQRRIRERNEEDRVRAQRGRRMPEKHETQVRETDASLVQLAGSQHRAGVR